MSQPIRGSRRRLVTVVAVLPGILVSLMPVELPSQSVPPNPPVFPDPIVYEGFVRNLALINRKADDLDRSGGRGSHLKEAVCGGLGLGVQDCVVVLQAARDLEAQLAQVDKQARGVIDEIGKRHKERRAGSVLPPPPPELAQLQAERNSLVEAGADTLKQQLTSSGLKTLSNYLVKRQDAITPTSPKPILK